MRKYYFFYYFLHDHIVSAAKGLEVNGHPVGGSLHAVNDANKFEITEDEWKNASIFDLKGKYQYRD